ncbi:MAG: DUF3822 family protein [Flavobacteriaceae bacterium]|nr:DUF3822 family protein [Flavobacteriaceae bacterium]
METLWKHITKSNDTHARTFGIYHNDIVHYLRLSITQKVLEYEIIKNPKELEIHTEWVCFDSLFQLAPSSFSHSLMPGLKQAIVREITETVSLLFDPFSSHPNYNTSLHCPNASMHLAESLFHIAQTQAKQKEYVLYLWYHENTAIVFAYQNQKLQFANAFNTSNLQETLYCALLPFNDQKLSHTQLALLVHCSANQHKATKQLFHKFIPQAEISSPSLPWITESKPPFLHIVSPLIQLASCASPVEV